MFYQHFPLTLQRWRVNIIGDARSEIKSLIPGFFDAWKKGDAAGVAAYYTKGTRVLFPNQEIIIGRDAFQAALQQEMDSREGVTETTIEIIELTIINEKTVYEIGKSTSKTILESGETITEKGKYVVIWKHEDGSWKLDVDITNTT